MTSSDDSPNLDPVQDHIKDMHIKSGNSSEDDAANIREVGFGTQKQDAEDRRKPARVKAESLSRSGSPNKRSQSASSNDADASTGEQLIGGDVTVKLEDGQAPKLEREAVKKVQSRPPMLFDHYEDKTQEAKSTFELIEQCTYASKSMADTEPAMDCDCAEEWDATTKSNLACGEDSDCVNRATKMECMPDCGCGPKCQNMRFQKRQFADISIIQTEKKGYGVRTNKTLSADQLIFEYIGEVIPDRQFRRRFVTYADEGIKHFYFMSISRTEYIDATKKGNLGRFLNHSCNPNCYVDKWIVGDKLRMGIFALRTVPAGSELVFNYNVDRYGADPQPCYCGEPNCTGFLGGKTQTERATKLPQATLEALGIDDDDGWDTTVAKRPRKKRVGEDDQEYVDSLQPRSLDEDGVVKVMATLRQCKEKWIAVKLLGRIERCEDTATRGRVVRMHGYQILKSVLNTFNDDVNVVLQALGILDSFPRLTRNKIADSKIEEVISDFISHDDERVSELSQSLLKEWATLEVAYRIPRIKRDPEAIRQRQQKRLELERRERRKRSRSRSRTRSPPRDAPKAPKGVSVPTGPRNHHPPFQRQFPKFPRAPQGPLPEGWFSTWDQAQGRTYYYTVTGRSSWIRPVAPSLPSKPQPRDNDLDKLISEITSEKERQAEAKAANATSSLSAEKDKAEKKKPKWMSLTEDKQKKLYQNTLSPHVKHVANKFKKKLPSDDIKRHFKDILKFMADSDFRKGRVQDPTTISEKQERTVKKYTKEYLDKALSRHREREQKKAAKLAEHSNAEKGGRSASSTNVSTPAKNDILDGKKDESEDDVVMELSDDEDLKAEIAKTDTPVTPMDAMSSETLKRKRRPDFNENGIITDDLPTSPNKRPRSTTPPPPPPPPPPPVEDIPPASAGTISSTDSPQNGWPSANGQLASSAEPSQQLPSHPRLQPDDSQMDEEDERDYGEDLLIDNPHTVQI